MNPIKPFVTTVILFALVSACGTAGITVSPTATPMPLTHTPVPPTATSALPTTTPVPPTDTLVPPTTTPVPPSPTPLPPTVTPVPPTLTSPPPTSTPLPLTDTPSPTNTPVPPTDTPTEVTPQPTATPPTKPGYFSRDELIEDTRQLAHVIESAHPDPYIRGGGRIAFHHRLHRLLNAIPKEGMTKDEFVRLLRPFVAAVGDAHTDLWGDYRVNDYAPGGVPLRFGIVEKSLYVAGVPGKAHEDLIGSILVSVEGVPLVELFQRQEQLQGTDNEYQVLQLLANQSLRYRPHMQDLLPEWENTDRVTVELKLQTGDIQEVVFDLSQTMPSLLTPKSEITLPAVNRSGFVYDFMDAEKRVAYLRVEHMMYYREAYEMWAVSGYRASTEETRATIPSATETFRSLVMDMKEAGTQALIIDLRGNNGGNSVLADILLYFLYGKESQ